MRAAGWRAVHGPSQCLRSLVCLPCGGRGDEAGSATKKTPPPASPCLLLAFFPLGSRFPIGRLVTQPAAAQALPLPADWRDFFALTKPRVMSLVIFTGLCGLLAAPGHVDPVLGFTAILCIALGAGGAAALNQWWEADLDAGMRRTKSRPLPAGRMERTSARDFGVGLAAASVLIMGLAVGWLA